MLSLNEIRARAFAFSKEWADDWSEDAEAKSFWDAFFNIFGVSRRRVANFERSVERKDGRTGFIDLLWKGVLLIEHKSRGKDLDRAYTQARDYFHGLQDRDLPRYVLVCDFQRFRLFDYDENKHTEFSLAELSENIHLFGFISGYQRRDFGKEDPVNIDAAERMGALHDMLKADGYEGHQLEVMLVRLLFCLFAEDTGIFEANLFREYIETRTSDDGSDLGYHLGMLFQVLNTPEDKRLKSLDEQIASFPYVNGKLFEEILPLAAFNSKMRVALLECCALDWSRISPAIFGSLFQSVMDEQARRNLGAHYTREQNILKVLSPLFLDDLRSELERLKTSRSTARKRQLQAYIEKLAGIRILDPACGCGNFLVIAYRELRQLELEALQLLYATEMQGHIDVRMLSQVNVDQCYGIEIEEFPAQIALVALWLTDHQMNMELSRTFGGYYARLPLEKSAKIVHNNALTLSWEEVITPQELTYIVGNPPFVGSNMLSVNQRAEMAAIFANVPNGKVLDYVAAWYLKAIMLMEKNPIIKTAFVSTNSISQGEQVSILWGELLKRRCHIFFAHRTFQWSSEARKRAAVHCVIVGFSLADVVPKTLFDYESPTGMPVSSTVTEITPYLTEGHTVLVARRNVPICPVPEIRKGNQPTDGGNLIIEADEIDAFIEREPLAQQYIKRLIGAQEYINNQLRYCLWLVGVAPEEIRKMPLVMERINKVRKMRSASPDAGTRRLADVPGLFRETNNPETFIVIPSVSSERREYIPMGFLDKATIATNLVLIIPDATLYHFGVLTSTMHMAWMRYVAGRLESRYRYSKDIVYNNFPWPEKPESLQIIGIENSAQAVLDARAEYPNATLSDLYDPDLMPVSLRRAHQALDRAVDRLYRKQPFTSDRERVEHLLMLYEKMTSLPFLQKAKKSRNL